MTAMIDTAPAADTEAIEPARPRMARIRRTTTSTQAAVAPFWQRVSDAVRRVLSPVTGLGWTCIVLGVAAWVVGWRAGWYEFMVLSAAMLLALLIAVPFLFSRALLDASLEVEPDRVIAGERAVGRLVVRNSRSMRILPNRVELVVGQGVARFDLPSLAPGAHHEELFVVPTRRRAVIPVGPVLSVSGDPLGLLRREVAWSETHELIVHPRVTRLDALGSGFLRDLEGQSTNHLSSSDIAFHTLRDYVPGDDRRFVHWRTSARTGRLMVRQFVDTRRSHAAVVLDLEPSSYEPAETDPEGDELELAVSVAASLSLRVLRDEQALTIIAGGARQPSVGGRPALDGLARLTALRGGDLPSCSTALSRDAADASIAFLVSGRSATLGQMRQTLRGLSADVRVISIRCRRGSQGTLREAAGLTLLELGELSQLAGLLRAAVR